MGKKKLISYGARNRNRAVDECRLPTFEPTISVERHIIIDGEAAEEYREALKNNLATGLRTNQYKRYRVLNPNALCLRLVDNAPVDPKYAREIAEELRYRLVGLTDRAPQFLALPVGRVACFKEPHPIRKFRGKSIVGVEPIGWRGPDARYATHDKKGARTPLGFIVGESEICTRVLGRVVKTPYAPVVVNSVGIPDHELMIVQDAVDESLPEAFEWQDSRVVLRTGRHDADVEIFHVRAPVFELAA